MFFFLLLTYIQDQSMARVNLNKSEGLVTNTTPASKYSHLFNKRGAWNKRGGWNFWKKLVHKT